MHRAGKALRLYRNEARQELRLAGRGRQGLVRLRRDMAPKAGIRGASLGLPLALAGRRLADGCPRPSMAMATGTVLPVEAVGLKPARALKTKGSFFLFPQANEADMPQAPAERACPVARWTRP